MDSMQGILVGLAHAATPMNLLFCFIGVALGTAVGVLPGLGPTATISLLLPITFRMEPASAVIMLAGIYYGAMYGGSITSILIRVPGEAASVITCIDGYEMARQGRAGKALGMAAFASFIAGILSVFGMALVGPVLARASYSFGPVEISALVVLGLVMVVMISSQSSLRALAMVALGLLLSTVGQDFVSGAERFTFGVATLTDGLGVAVMAIGLFGISEILVLAAEREDKRTVIASPRSTRELLPDRADWRAAAGPIGRGSALGFFLGLLPGAGALVASFASYVIEKKMARDPSRFGKGAIEGVAGPEAANNAAAQSAFIPLLSLGIPSNAVMGVVLGALMIQGVAPGPKLATDRPEIFWGVIASMLFGNLILIILNVPLVRVFVSLLRMPTALLAPAILLFCTVGAYSANNSMVDVAIAMACGVLGYALRRNGFDPVPLLIAFVLGGILEKTVRQSLLIGYGSPAVYLDRPIAFALLLAAAAMLCFPLVRKALAARFPASSTS